MKWQLQIILILDLSKLKHKNKSMKIYKYNPNCKEWENIRNSKLVGIERENAFNECVKNIGVELTLLNN